MTMNSNETKKALNPLPFLILVLVLAVTALVYYVWPRPESEPEPESEVTVTPEPEVLHIEPSIPETTTVTVEEVEAVLEPASDLITSRYYYTNAADFDSVLTWFGSELTNPFTHSKGYIIYDGVVSTGIDLSDVKIDVDNEGEVITIHLPSIHVLAHEIDDSSVRSDTSESIFNNLDAEYYAALIDEFKKETEQKVLSNSDYMKEVRHNTELVLQNFLHTADITKDFTIMFTD
ncbi:MAG: DUF4230 domain-containing protein [Solobacterium sp.]|nr:DUF4230 domain-containing protein [Solobacterium sp.]